MNLSTEKKIMDLENRLVVAWGEGEGVEGIGSLQLMDANYCFWTGLTMRSCCVALRTMSTYLHHNTTMGGKCMYTCMCNWVPMLYSGGKKKVCWGNNNKKTLSIFFHFFVSSSISFINVLWLLVCKSSPVWFTPRFWEGWFFWLQF